MPLEALEYAEGLLTHRPVDLRTAWASVYPRTQPLDGVANDSSLKPRAAPGANGGLEQRHIVLPILHMSRGRTFLQ
jgi:hypothetical protein